MRFINNPADPTFSIALADKAAPGFVQQFEAAFDNTYKPLALTLAAQQIDMNINDKSILVHRPLNAIKIVPKIESGSHKSGQYDPPSKTILLRENVVMRLMAIQVLIHEYGHHLDFQWLYGTKARTKAVAEYNAEKAKVEKRLGKVIPTESFDTIWQDLLKAGTDAVSLYSLRTDDEWMAEAFALYFSGYGPLLHQRAPATHAAIENLCRGVA